MQPPKPDPVVGVQGSSCPWRPRNCPFPASRSPQQPLSQPAGGTPKTSHFPGPHTVRIFLRYVLHPGISTRDLPPGVGRTDYPKPETPGGSLAPASPPCSGLSRSVLFHQIFLPGRFVVVSIVWPCRALCGLLILQTRDGTPPPPCIGSEGC